jgi:hypothetical protein
MSKQEIRAQLQRRFSLNRYSNPNDGIQALEIHDAETGAVYLVSGKRYVYNAVELIVKGHSDLLVQVR